MTTMAQIHYQEGWNDCLKAVVEDMEGDLRKTAIASKEDSTK